MGPSWVLHGSFMGPSWVLHGSFMGLSWVFMGFHWFSLVFMGFHGFSWVLHGLFFHGLFFHGCSLVFMGLLLAGSTRLDATSNLFCRVLPGRESVLGPLQVRQQLRDPQTYFRLLFTPFGPFLEETGLHCDFH